MNLGRYFMGNIWNAVTGTFNGIIHTLAQGGFPGMAWLNFEQGVKEYLGWANLTAASKIRYRVTHKVTALPEAKPLEAKVILPNEDVAPALEIVAQNNPWFAEHKHITDPLVAQRAEWVRATEERYWNARREQLAAYFRKDKKVKIEPLERLDMRRRTAHGEIANVSEQVQMAVPEISDAFPFAEYFTRDDKRVRPTHVPMIHFVATRSWHGWPRIVPLDGFNCFLPDTVVEGSFLAAFRALYQGPAITIETSSGARLSVTANHPIFTPQGWVPACKLYEGCNLLCNNRHVEGIATAMGVDDYKNGTTTENVFQTFLAKRIPNAHSMFFRHTSDLDFYGDAQWFIDQVNVVLSTGDLQEGFDSQFSEFCLQDEFILANAGKSLATGFSPFNSFFKTANSSFRRFPSAATLPFNQSRVFFDRSPFQEFGGGSSTNFDAISFEHSPDRRSFTTQFKREGFEGHSAFVQSNDFRNVPVVPLRYGAASHWDVSLNESFVNVGGANAKFIGDIFHRSSGAVSLDSVAKIKRFDYSGHVYDFQSETGWILANNIVTSNCRCYLIYLTKKQAIERGFMNKDGLAKFEAKWPNSLSRHNYEKGLFPDKGWAGPKFWTFPSPPIRVR